MLKKAGPHPEIIMSTAFMAVFFIKKYHCMKFKTILLLAVIPFVAAANSYSQGDTKEAPVGWQTPPEEIMNVLHAPQLPWVSTSPTGKTMLLMDPVLYPKLSELAAPMHKLAGMRVNPATNGWHGEHGGISPRLLDVEGGNIIPLDFPDEAEVYSVAWTIDGQRFALTAAFADHIGLFVGSVDGKIKHVRDLALNPLLGAAASWLPGQEKLLLRRIPDRGAPPPPPEIPAGPMIFEGEGASARSTYEARDLLETAHDDALFDYYTSCELVVYDPGNGKMEVIGSAAPYTTVDYSPDGKYILVEYLVGPWSHEVAYWRFAHEIEVWNNKGKLVKTIASLPVADAVPVHGVTLGPRGVSWRSTAPHTLYWVEALDGGDPVAEVSHRDKLMRSTAPFTLAPEEVYRAEHRIISKNAWFADGDVLMLTERERIRRWRYTWLLDVKEGTTRLWFDQDEDDEYGDPGYPLMRPLPNGNYVIREKDGAVYFRGTGATAGGDRPFLDLRYLDSGKTERLFRCDPDRYEYFLAFAGGEDRFIFRSESAVDVPNYYLAEIGEKIEAPEGEAVHAITRKPITNFEDPTPQLRQITKEIVKYERNDGVPLSFQLHLPPDYEEGTPLPTVVYAYPLEYSGAATAGQVRGSAQRFMRLYGASHLFFLMQGYAVLERTAMPMIGDPETTYNTFVPQLVADAEAAVKKAVEMGVADPGRIGVIGHSHGGLMVANLLAHTDLFAAGIARSGSYNKTNQPFGFQSERRSLFEARDVYIQVSPTFFADQVNEPVLIIHGNDDSNPGTLTFQSEVFYEAVRGSGGTARLILLPYEDHGYRAIESIEHVLWEQLRWFDKYVKNAE